MKSSDGSEERHDIIDTKMHVKDPPPQAKQAQPSIQQQESVKQQESHTYTIEKFVNDINKCQGAKEHND